MKLDFFCVAEDVRLGSDNNPIVHNLLNNITAPEFPYTLRCIMCCIVAGTVDERPEFFDFSFALKNEAGEYQQGYSISVRSIHGYDDNNPQSLRSVHVLPAGKLTFKAPGTYTARMMLENGNALEQTIIVEVQP